MVPNVCIQPERGSPTFRHSDGKDDSVNVFVKLQTSLLVEMGLPGGLTGVHWCVNLLYQIWGSGGKILFPSLFYLPSLAETMGKL